MNSSMLLLQRISLQHYCTNNIASVTRLEYADISERLKTAEVITACSISNPVGLIRTPNASNKFIVRSLQSLLPLSFS